MKKRLNPHRADLCIPRMSWSPENLFNLHQRTFGAQRKELTFTKSSKTLFQQQWFSKKLCRGYHGDWIQEHKFQKSFLPLRIPPIVGNSSSSSTVSKLNKGKGVEERQKNTAKVPLGSLMFGEVERRLDVLVFRACFAPSAYAAKMLVVNGQVTLNGVKFCQQTTNPNVKLNPGDFYSVEPKAIPMLDPSYKQKYNTLFTSSSSSESSESDSTPKESSLPAGVKPFNLPDYAAPFVFVPPYLEVSFPTCSAIYVRHPTAGPGYSEIPTPYAADGEIVRLAWEWYQKTGRGRRRLPHKRLMGSDYKGRGMDRGHIWQSEVVEKSSGQPVV